MEGNCKHICFITFMTHDHVIKKKVNTNLHRKRLHFHVMCNLYRVSKKTHTHTIDSSALQNVKNMWLQLNVYVIISCSHFKRTCLLKLIFMVIQYLFFNFEKLHCPNNKKAPNHCIIQPNFQNHHKLVWVLDVLSMWPQTINMWTMLKKLNFNLRPWKLQKLMIRSATLRKKTCMVFPPLWKCLFRKNKCWYQF